jgi:hypothetical protein
MKKTTHMITGPNGIFEIRDPAVDVETLVKEIESNLTTHRLLLAPSPSIPAFGSDSEPPAAGRALSHSDLLYRLRCVQESLVQVGADRELAPSWATQLPLVGRWWSRIRAEVHNLILFYVNRAAARQAGLNNHTVAVLRWIPEQAEEIERLKTQVALLEDRLRALEAEE